MTFCFAITGFAWKFKVTLAVMVAFVIVYNIGYYNGEFTDFFAACVSCVTHMQLLFCETAIIEMFLKKIFIV